MTCKHTHTNPISTTRHAEISLKGYKQPKTYILTITIIHTGKHKHTGRAREFLIIADRYEQYPMLVI